MSRAGPKEFVDVVVPVPTDTEAISREGKERASCLTIGDHRGITLDSENDDQFNLPLTVLDDING